MKKMKKLTAAVLVITLTFVLIGNALAGSIMDTLKNTVKTAWNGLKTAGNAVCDTAVYVFTDDDARTAYRSTIKAAGKTADAATEVADAAKQIPKDAKDVYEGAKKVVNGAKELVKNGNLVDAYHYVTGNGTVNEETRRAMDQMKEGYRQMDNGLVLDVIKLVPGYGVIAAAGIDVVKTGAEYAVGYIDEEQVMGQLTKDLIDATVGAVAAGAGELVEGVGAELAVKTAGIAGREGLKQLAE